MWDYSDKVVDHFLHPRNVGEIADPDAVGMVGNISCGDALKLTLKIDDGVIKDAKFKTFGCASAIASSSVLTELIKGKTVDEAGTITNDDIAGFLGGLPGEKMHCSVMGKEALDQAIAHYRGEPAESVHHHVDSIVCSCFMVTENKIRAQVKEHELKTVEDVTHYTKAGGGCGKCVPRIQEILDEIWQGAGKACTEQPVKLTNIQKMKLIDETISTVILPMLKQDGGDIDLVDIVGDKVYVALKGRCAGCPASGATLKNAVESQLRERVDRALIVEEVT